MQSLADLGFLNDEARDYLSASSPPLAWHTVLARMVGVADDADTAYALIERIHQQ